MSGSYWNQVLAGRARGPVGPPARRPHRRADPDARLHRPRRRATARPTPTLATWIDRGVYDDLLAGLGDGMAAGLRVGLGEHGHRRASSAAASRRWCSPSASPATTSRPLVCRRQGARAGATGSRPGCCASATCAASCPARAGRTRSPTAPTRSARSRESPHLGRPRAHGAARRASPTGCCCPSSGCSPPASPTGWRGATMTRAAPQRLPLRRARAVGRPAARPRPAPARSATTTGDPFLVGGNAAGVPARAATSSSRSAPRPPAVRSDLLLVLVDALRATNPHYLLHPVTTPG